MKDDKWVDRLKKIHEPTRSLNKNKNNNVNLIMSHL